MSKRTLSLFVLIPALAVAANAAGLEGLKASSSLSFSKDLSSSLETMAPKDLFAEVPECSVVDARFIRAPKLEEALNMLRPCAKALTRRTAVPVSFADPEGPVEASAPSLEVRLGAGALAASSFMRDLRFSLEKREHSLLGFPAKIVRGDWKPLAKAGSSRRSRREAMPEERSDEPRSDTDLSDLDELGNPRRETSDGPDSVSDGDSRGGSEDGPLF